MEFIFLSSVIFVIGIQHEIDNEESKRILKDKVLFWYFLSASIAFVNNVLFKIDIGSTLKGIIGIAVSLFVAFCFYLLYQKIYKKN